MADDDIRQAVHLTREATPEEGRRMLDEAARKYLGMSREEFLRAYAAGVLSHDAPGVAQVAALIPFGLLTDTNAHAERSGRRVND